MRRGIIGVMLSMMCYVGAMAQSKDFMQVYDACVYTHKSMMKGKGSNAEIAQASAMLKDAKWEYLRLYVDIDNAAGDVPFGEKNIVFSPEYLQKFSEDKTLVYKKAKEYAEEQATAMRDAGKVRLCTKCVAGKKSVTYKISQQGETLDVAAVAEVNGLVNLYVTIKDKDGKMHGPYKETSEEFKGTAFRKVHVENVPKGKNTVFITIENKYKKAKSVAIIFE